MSRDKVKDIKSVDAPAVPVPDIPVLAKNIDCQKIHIAFLKLQLAKEKAERYQIEFVQQEKTFKVMLLAARKLDDKEGWELKINEDGQGLWTPPQPAQPTQPAQVAQVAQAAAAPLANGHDTED